MAKVRAGGGDGAVRAQWRSRLQRFAQGGRSVAQFCAAEGVSAWSLYDWRRKLGAELRQRQPPAAARAKPRASEVAATGFIDLGVAHLGCNGERGERMQPAVSAGIELRIDLGGGVLLQVLRR